MEPQHQALASRTLAHYTSLNSTNPGSRLLIAVAGPPGSGKTTSTTAIARILNTRMKQSPPLAAVISMDGFHYPRSYLDTLPNAAEAYVRRGAPWTFDAEGIVRLISRSRGVAASGKGEVMIAPTFDHALKDPIDDGLIIEPETRILIFEGNYLLVDEEPWSRIRELVDERWWVSVGAEEARMRVARRHVAAGIERNMVDALKRVDANDSLNGVYITEHSRDADVVIKNIEEKV
ncbi:uncharacterized protein BP5553_07496 [Venustampulla echinocandica]|uniref:Phosphoribulokinase/uridine kinase domain-containing protein n=1 Tax=Venustampulla echinocandica TaxID=2656787 RepID=A0A370TGQ2_9HELO|nr:uncharacterized protein BP5553_07496 [Venustampulla echinocandica]RDL34368.1 hypothetical protein BP5553_07496 [Venustampulla echinocandica]